MNDLTKGRTEEGRGIQQGRLVQITLDFRYCHGLKINGRVGWAARRPRREQDQTGAINNNLHISRTLGERPQVIMRELI